MFSLTLYSGLSKDAGLCLPSSLSESSVQHLKRDGMFFSQRSAVIHGPQPSDHLLPIACCSHPVNPMEGRCFQTPSVSNHTPVTKCHDPLAPYYLLKMFLCNILFCQPFPQGLFGTVCAQVSALSGTPEPEISAQVGPLWCSPGRKNLKGTQANSIYKYSLLKLLPESIVLN